MMVIEDLCIYLLISLGEDLQGLTPSKASHLPPILSCQIDD